MKLFRRMLCKMEPQKTEFDILAGGQQELTSDLAMTKFVAARVQELGTMSQSIDNPTKTALVFQQLPRYMRRRAMSHNANRMPRRLREPHINQLEKSGMPLKSKRPSRKFRRRPSNLLAEYNRRQRKNVWLETHKWHAKRFHVVVKWGYKIANFPNDKSVRACYRASASNCLLQDISFNVCIELEGPENKLLEGLSAITDPACGLTFAAKSLLGGNREGSAVLFHRGEYPKGAIGEVSFMWRPLDWLTSGRILRHARVKHGLLPMDVERSRNLWIWVHPSFYQEVVDELVAVFGLSPLEDEIIPCVVEDEDEENVKRKKLAKESRPRKNVDQLKLATRNIPFIRVPKFSNGAVRMALLKDTLNRFRLQGPSSGAILSSCLRPANIVDIRPARKPRDSPNGGLKRHHLEGIAVKRDANGCVKQNNNTVLSPLLESDLSSGDESIGVKQKRGRSRPQWWQYFYATDDGKKAAAGQRAVWQDLEGALSPAQVPPRAILGLTVRDPRVLLPPKRTKVLPDIDVTWDTTGESLGEFPTLLSASPLWEAWVRDEVTTTKTSDNQMNEIRARHTIPGTPLDLGQDEARVPVILIQRPGSQDPKEKRLGYGCGWDVIVPPGWAMAFWISLVYRGARVGGLREAAATAYEQGQLPAPWNCPDSAACRMEERVKRREKTDQHFRRPPDKRTNFVKLGAVAPFHCPWNKLVQDWSKDAEGSKSEDSPDSSKTGEDEPPNFWVLRDKSRLHRLQRALDNEAGEAVGEGSEAEQCLVAVRLHMDRRGRMGPHSMVCLPNPQDIAGEPAEEPLHRDENEAERHRTREEHRKVLRRLKRKRRRLRQRLKEAGGGRELDRRDLKRNQELSSLDSSGPSKQHDEKQRAMWLPPVSDVKESCSRSVAGFVCEGEFSFTEACGESLGFMALPALTRLMRTREWNPQLLVVMRNPNCRLFRLASVSIVL